MECLLSGAFKKNTDFLMSLVPYCTMQRKHCLILTIQHKYLRGFSILWRFFAAGFSKMPESKRVELFEGYFYSIIVHEYRISPWLFVLMKERGQSPWNTLWMRQTNWFQNWSIWLLSRYWLSKDLFESKHLQFLMKGTFPPMNPLDLWWPSFPTIQCFTLGDD